MGDFVKFRAPSGQIGAPIDGARPGPGANGLKSQGPPPGPRPPTALLRHIARAPSLGPVPTARIRPPMPDIRDMELLASLARHGHFARAAEACGISQPAFSARIRNLELELGAPVVKRGNRFLGFTREGEIALVWARRLLADRDGLRQEISAAKGALEGRLRVGAVPTTLTFVAQAPARLRAAHPKLIIEIVSASSSEIRSGLEEVSMGAGVTYLDAALPAQCRAETLYAERYVLLCPPALAPRATGTVSWAEAAELPLCLLTQNMRNRRILDDAFAAVGRAPRPVMESNTFTTALLQVTAGIAATIAPEVLAESLPLGPEILRLALAEPVVEKPICLVTSDRAPPLPAVAAFRAAVLGLVAAPQPSGARI